MKKVIAAVLLTVGSLTIYAGVNANEEKVTICHAAGQDGTTQYVTLTISRNAAFGQAGHFNEDGTPQAGHENDYLGACIGDETTTIPETTSVEITLVETTEPEETTSTTLEESTTTSSLEETSTSTIPTSNPTTSSILEETTSSTIESTSTTVVNPTTPPPPTFMSSTTIPTLVESSTTILRNTEASPNSSAPQLLPATK